MFDLDSRWLAGGIAGAVLGLAAGPALALCDLELQDVETASWNAGGGYDVFDTVGYADRFTVDVVSGEGSDELCRVAVVIEPSGGTVLEGPGRLGYELRQEPNRRNGTAGVTFEAALQPGERAQFAYHLFLPPGQFVPDGVHEGRLTVTAFEELGGSRTVADMRQAPARALVGTGARVSFVGAVGRRQTVDFGELTDGRRAPPVFLDVRSTSDYDIRVRSEQRGELVQIAGAEVWAVAYDAALDGRTLDLSAGETVLRFSGPTEPAGRRVPLDLRIGAVGDKRAGAYRDRLVIEVTPAGR